VALSSLVLHTGLSSFQDDAYDAEHHLYEEWFELPADTALAVESARRVIAVGTTVVRALETAGRTGRPLHPQRGWTRLRITPQTPIGVVAALLTGFHEPVASHFELLRAFLREPLLDQAYAEAVERAYRWHEFGDLMLIL
jgi:S-adenosylmethionine:tRNA ribosyltransferase-isomerase